MVERRRRSDLRTKQPIVLVSFDLKQIVIDELYDSCGPVSATKLARQINATSGDGVSLNDKEYALHAVETALEELCASGVVERCHRPSAEPAPEGFTASGFIHTEHVEHCREVGIIKGKAVVFSSNIDDFIFED